MKKLLMAATCLVTLNSPLAHAQHHGSGFGAAFGGAALGGVLGSALGNVLTQPQPPPPVYVAPPPPVIYQQRVYVRPAPPVYVPPMQHVVYHPWIGPGFACYEPESSSVTRAICGTQDLSAASLALVQTLHAVIQQSPYNGAALRGEYAAFMQSERTACAPYAYQQQIDCISGMLSHERDILMSRLSGALLDEASRPTVLNVQVQQRLHDLGLLVGVVDGVYGDGTRRAIAVWQTDQGRPATGVVASDEVALLIPGYQGAPTVPDVTVPAPQVQVQATPPVIHQAASKTVLAPAPAETVSDPLGGLHENMPYALARPKLFAAGWQTQVFKVNTLSDQDRDQRQWFTDHHMIEVEDCSSSGCKMQFHNADGRLLYVYTQSGSHASDAYRGVGPSVVAYCLDVDDITCPAPSPVATPDIKDTASK